MLEGQTKPLQVAARVLSVEQLKAISRSPFNLKGWAIADRWALNSPEALRVLAGKGAAALRERLLQQQEMETRALMDAAEQLAAGMAEHEVLAMAEISTELE